MTTAIRFENVSKQYRLGEVGTGTLSHDLHRAWARFRGKPDPFAKVGSENKRDEAGGDYVWALKDVTFDVKQGEVLAIIGRNGAGKSTLLKLLSRIMAPTTGSIKAKGRIASLLEVGTGFHGELTGRENIYLNGAILGMRRQEVAKQLDAMIEFSGCAKYIDTPVKRYSSGMTVRLGFAVAAHLECEILVVDEVLAVGDMEFQKKCIGKMREVASGGRTVLFVSHNMPAVRSLCTSGVLLEQGRTIFAGDVHATLERYFAGEAQSDCVKQWEVEEAPQDDVFRLRKVAVECDEALGFAPIERPTNVEIEFEVLKPSANVCVSVHVHTQGAVAFVGANSSAAFDRGTYRVKCVLPANLLNAGMHTLTVFLITNVTEFRVVVREVLTFHMNEMEARQEYVGPIIGFVRPKLAWSTIPVKKIANSHVGVTN